MLNRFKKILLIIALAIFVSGIFAFPLTKAEEPGPPQPPDNSALCQSLKNSMESEINYMEDAVEELKSLPMALTIHERTYPIIAEFSDRKAKTEENLIKYAKLDCGETDFNRHKKELGAVIIEFNEEVLKRVSEFVALDLAVGTYQQYQDKEKRECQEIFDTINFKIQNTNNLIIAGDDKSFDEADQKIKEIAKLVKQAEEKGCDRKNPQDYQRLKTKLQEMVKKYQEKNQRRGDRAASWLGIIEIMLKNIFNAETCKNSCIVNWDKSGIGKTFSFLNEGLCGMMCIISKMLTDFIEWTFGLLEKAAGISKNFFIPPAYAQLGSQAESGVAPAGEAAESVAPAGTTSGTSNEFPPLSDAINPNISSAEKNPDSKTQWIFKIWNFCLSLVNVFVAGVLIFLAFVNILRIQVDTYALKKILPTLIIGVILANFSLLICRMVVDFSDILSKTFIDNREQLVKDLKNALGIFPSPEKESAGLGVVSLAIVVVVMGIGAIPGVGWGISLIALIVAFIVAVIPAIAILILAFLLYIRTAVIYVLVAVSPLAFICLVLPATQGLFRQWWGQFARWVFMAPIVFLLLKIASMVQSPNKASLFAFVIALAMLYLAIQVPFKMGGAVMAMWGGMGKWAGKRAGGWAGRGIDTWMADKFGWSPAGLYQGWVEGAQERRKDVMAGAIGTGRRLREKVLAGPRPVPLREGLIGWGKESLPISEAETKLMGEWKNRAQQLAPHGDEMRRMFDNSVASGQFDTARDAYLALAAGGNATTADQAKFTKLAASQGKSAQAYLAESLVKSLSREAASRGGSGGHPLVSSLTKEGGKIQQRSAQAIRDDYIKSFRNLPGETDAQKQSNLLVDSKLHLAPNGVLLNRSEFTTDIQHALADIIASYGPQHKFIVSDKLMVEAATKYRIKPKLELDLRSLNLDQKAAGQLTQALQNPEALEVSAIRDINIAYQVQSVHNNWQNLKPTIEQKFQQLRSQLHSQLQSSVPSDKMKLNRDLAVELHTKLKGLNLDKAANNAEVKKIEDFFRAGDVYQKLQRTYDKYRSKQKSIKQFIKDYEKRSKT